MKTDIAVVIVNWNKKQEVVHLLSELVGIPEAVDIYVVDNASTDDSVKSISDAFPEVKIIVNKQNLGGTGGFNTGLNHVCQGDQYSYVWLLDNDARIKNDSLTELLDAMNADTGIGLAGSRIVDTDNEEITVETGGKLRWNIIGIESINRNISGNLFDKIKADYVAICSALVRIQALRKVGLMDDRLFLCWDDMDWGLYFSECGYKVLCVSKSIVFHGSFTERERGKPTEYYYNIRNSFLVYSKHTSFFQGCFLFYRTLRNHFRVYKFYAFHNKHEETKLMRKAFYDFLKNHWGSLMMNEKTEISTSPTPIHKRKLRPDTPLNNILVSVVGSNLEESQSMLKSIIEVYPESKITILVHDDRIEYFGEYDHILVSRKMMQRLNYVSSKFLSIKRKDFDAAVAIHPYPFLYATRKIIFVDKNGELVSENRSGMINLSSLGLSLAAGEIMAHIFFPLVILKSLQYKQNAKKLYCKSKQL